MSTIRERCDDRSPLLGLLVGGMAALLAQIVPCLTDLAGSQNPLAITPCHSCVYEIFEGKTCLGTVFADQPQTLQDILRMIGRSDRARFADLQRCVPCGSSVTIADDSSCIRMRPLSGAKLMAAGRRIDVNRAHPSDLACIPGIGPKTAERIVQERSNRQGFSRIDDLKTISGIGEKKLQTLAQWLEISPWPGNARSAIDRTNSD